MSFYQYVLMVLIIFAAIVLIRVLKGPTIWDRLMGFNMISAKIIMSIVILAVILNESFFLDVALAYAVLGFIGTILIAKFIEKKGVK
ncbi:pH regulation protein F [Mobilitalea sibirica]|uniref:pH regulation protein F n=1 Tax=Mobilitalea sibirica TaxID=1462919 RepID=A0A8J7H054_9FIRM|nr:monovalent cation/H+ antiporter complex subunit F [Mobilitalea sibirica]MBH1939344.1 pH regulation protein F [Mobilitalea sibirica]